MSGEESVYLDAVDASRRAPCAAGNYMTRIFSNWLTGTLVVNPYDRLIEQASQISLAAPYYTEFKQIVRGAAAGKSGLKTLAKRKVS